MQDKDFERLSEQHTQELDEINANAVKIILRQREKGISKYGQVISDNHAAIIERIEHAQEEAADLLVYLEWIKQGMLRQ